MSIAISVVGSIASLAMAGAAFAAPIEGSGHSFNESRTPSSTLMAQYVPQQPFVPNVTPQEALRNPPQFGMPTPQMHNDLKGRLSEEGIVRRYPDTPTYSGGLGVSSRGAGALSGESNSDLCKPLLRKYQITGVTKWRSRYNGCLRGNFNGLDHLDE